MNDEALDFILYETGAFLRQKHTKQYKAAFEYKQHYPIFGKGLKSEKITIIAPRTCRNEGVMVTLGGCNYFKTRRTNNAPNEQEAEGEMGTLSKPPKPYHLQRTMLQMQIYL